RISATIRTARSRSSGGYLLDEPPDMTPSFPRTGVSGHAGAVQTAGARPTTKGCKTPGKPNAQHYAASNAA
ncbi:hypothetical protein, partial [Mycobacterium tuberculosis]|uniref:hypothetical protein n=1 Tax=Mycobacterium tuberculosis TaxID=1773 RepID=UPI001C008A32